MRFLLFVARKILRHRKLAPTITRLILMKKYAIIIVLSAILTTLFTNACSPPIVTSPTPKYVVCKGDSCRIVEDKGYNYP